MRMPGLRRLAVPRFYVFGGGHGSLLRPCRVLPAVQDHLFLFCKCLGIPNSPRSLDLDDRQGLIARSAMQQKKKTAVQDHLSGF